MAEGIRIDVAMNIFPRLSGDFPRRTSEAIGLGLFKVLEEADPRTPRDTGNLAGGAMVRFNPGAQDGTVYWPAPYAAHQEFGTRFHAPQPFARPAVDIVQPQLIEAMKQAAGGMG